MCKIWRGKFLPHFIQRILTIDIFDFFISFSLSFKIDFDSIFGFLFSFSDQIFIFCSKILERFVTQQLNIKYNLYCITVIFQVFFALTSSNCLSKCSFKSGKSKRPFGFRLIPLKKFSRLILATGSAVAFGGDWTGFDWFWADLQARFGIGAFSFASKLAIGRLFPIPTGFWGKDGFGRVGAVVLLRFFKNDKDNSHNFYNCESSKSKKNKKNIPNWNRGFNFFRGWLYRLLSWCCDLLIRSYFYFSWFLTRSLDFKMFKQFLKNDFGITWHEWNYPIGFV